MCRYRISFRRTVSAFAAYSYDTLPANGLHRCWENTDFLEAPVVVILF